MKKILLLHWLIITLILLAGCESTSTPPANSGAANSSTAPAAAALTKPEAEKIIQRLATQDGCKDSTAEMRMSFTDADGKAQQLDFRVQRKYEAAKISTLITIIAPPEDSEKALLAFEEAGKPTDAISYLAGLKKTAHLKSDNPVNFRGSKSTVQEMLNLEFNQYDIAEIVAGSAPDTSVIQLAAKADTSLAYPKMNVVVRGKEQTIERFELLNDKGEKIKTITAAEVKTIQNRQAITKMAIEDHKNKQSLQAEVRSIKYDSNLPATIFTEATLIKNVTAASQKLMQ